jgi:hypothetical protein
MMNKKRFALLILLLFLSANDLYAKAQVLERKMLSNPARKCIEIRSTGLFVDNDKNTFVRINNFLYVNNKWIKMDKYGRRLNGFLKDGRLYMAFEKDRSIDIYNIKKDFELTSRIKIIEAPNILWGGAKFEKIFAVPGKDNLYFLQGECNKLPTNPFELLFFFTSGGHGILYKKPFLAEVRDDKMLRYLKFRYRGKLDESFYIKEASGGENSINFLGFRQLEKPSMGPRHPRQPVILYYADYNLEKRKVIRNHTLHEDTARYDKDTDTRFDYGPLSMDNFGDDVFIAFSWRGSSGWSTKGFDIRDVKSDIYYWECGKSRFGDIEKIAEGFSPVVRADLFGNVHVVWVDSDGVFFHKMRKDAGWGGAEIILSDVDICPDVAVTGHISAEFDKDNNLNMIYPSNSNLIYVKVKLN